MLSSCMVVKTYFLKKAHCHRGVGVSLLCCTCCTAAYSAASADSCLFYHYGFIVFVQSCRSYTSPTLNNNKTIIYTFEQQWLCQKHWRLLFRQKQVAINNIEFKSEQKKGDSYLSTVNAFTVKAHGKDKSNHEEKVISFPILSKSLPSNIGWRNTFRSADFFRNEVIFYNKVWKAMNDFQMSKNTKVPFHAIPLYICGLADGTNDYIALENLNTKGFYGLTRSGGLDLEHTQQIMRIFARFHALALAFKDQKPKEFEEVANSLEETYFSEKYRSWYSNFQINNLFPIVCDAVEKELPQMYMEKLKNLFANDFYGKLIEYCATKGPLAVITHGDAWAPNFLLKYDNNNTLIDAMMIDFQLTRYASLALDISFFLYSCTEQSLRLSHWDFLIEDYYKTFVSVLEDLGSSSELLTLDSLKAEIKACALFGVGMSMEAIAMSLLEDDEVADLEGIGGDEYIPLEKVWILNPLKTEKKRQRLAYMIKHAVDNGFM
ncbi:hypothetical protein RN001_003101 [Aquatica leii]|uniref:CHK kinase-like domain-containing protein n=1 Tax=Aquatica leii TaxID=1421715 RepID=A0AAN7SSY8_9COLE|nr:hypothetical protein RN001_003101 [Aquatica leii]